MTHKIVGLFESRDAAQAAMQELTAQGFSSEHIDISNMRMNNADDSVGSGDEIPRSNDGPISGTLSTTEVSPSPDFVHSITNFFRSLFGSDETRISNYSNAAQDAEAILTVEIGATESAETAHAIMDRNGAINVDESDSNSQSAIS